jgi:broad specificity phosphatase PhoE
MQDRTWYLVRHGETEWNASSRMQGQLDSPLTPLGRDHALNSARLLARLGVDVAFASPLGRARETVEIISAELPPAPFSPMSPRRPERALRSLRTDF